MKIKSGPDHKTKSGVLQVFLPLHFSKPNWVNCPRICSLLGLGRRTLQRRLAQHDLVFGDMVEDIRRSIALDYLAGSEYSLTDIAHMLGYNPFPLTHFTVEAIYE